MKPKGFSSEPAISALEHDPEKWGPVFRKKIMLKKG
jgi:hypothetical protein